MTGESRDSPSRVRHNDHNSIFGLRNALLFRAFSHRHPRLTKLLIVRGSVHAAADMHAFKITSSFRRVIAWTCLAFPAHILS